MYLHACSLCHTMVLPVCFPLPFFQIRTLPYHLPSTGLTDAQLAKAQVCSLSSYNPQNVSVLSYLPALSHQYLFLLCSSLGFQTDLHPANVLSSTHKGFIQGLKSNPPFSIKALPVYNQTPTFPLENYQEQSNTWHF